MLRIERILFPTDFFPCADQALEHAIYLSRRYGAELHALHAVVLHADDPHNFAAHVKGLEEAQLRVEELAGTRMREAFHDRDAADVRVVTERRRGFSAADVILDYADEKEVDLVVMGTHGRRGLGHLFLGSVAEEVVRLATCPVLTIRERRAALTAESVNRVLVPFDFSRHATEALRYAREIATTYGASLDLVHVVEQVLHPEFYEAAGMNVSAALPEIERRARKELARLIEETPGPEVESEIHVIEGRAARDVVEFARGRDSDLIVIATHGLTGIRHLLLGSVAEKVVRTAPCPVLTVKPFGRSLLPG